MGLRDDGMVGINPPKPSDSKKGSRGSVIGSTGESSAATSSVCARFLDLDFFPLGVLDCVGDGGWIKSRSPARFQKP